MLSIYFNIGGIEVMRKSFLLIVTFILCLFVVLPMQSKAAVADGTHTLNYQVNKPGSASASMANDYFLKPAKLIVKDGKMTVQLTIKNSSWVTEFNPPGGAKVISSGNDQRTVQFNVNSLDRITVGMKIDIDDIDYHHSYSVDFVFSGDSLPQAVAQQPASEQPKEQPSKEQPVTNNQAANSSSGSQSSSNIVTNPSSANDKPKDQQVEDNVSMEEEPTNEVDETATEQQEVVENPETSDSLPLLFMVGFLVAAFAFMRLKKQTV